MLNHKCSFPLCHQTKRTHSNSLARVVVRKSKASQTKRVSTLSSPVNALSQNASVDSYDWFDSDFAEMYPEHKWLSDSTVRFGYQISDSKRRSDSLTVSNATNEPVRYLKITIGDMLFLFDLSPGATIDLQVPHEGWLSWVAATGTFVDGQMIPVNGVNFFHRDKLTVPLHYCLTVTQGKIRIASTVIDGYNGDARPEKPNAPKVARCDELARP